MYPQMSERIWNALTDERRRAILDQFTMTADIPSSIIWNHLDYGTKSAIVFTGVMA